MGWFVCLLLQVGLWVNCGSRYETTKNNGAAFFLEHLAFKVMASAGIRRSGWLEMAKCTQSQLLSCCAP